MDTLYMYMCMCTYAEVLVESASVPVGASSSQRAQISPANSIPLCELWSVFIFLASELGRDQIRSL